MGELFKVKGQGQLGWTFQCQSQGQGHIWYGFSQIKMQTKFKVFDSYMWSYSQLSEFYLLLDLDLTFDANNRLCHVHNIQAYVGKFFLNDVSKILTLGTLFKVRVKNQGQSHIWCSFS